MMKRVCPSLLFVALLFLAGCMGARDIYQENPVAVETLTLGEVQENPRRITATLTGYTGVCERLKTRQRREGKTFYLSVVGIYEGPADAVCPAVAREYTQTVTLDLEGLEPGVYSVRADDESDTFTLPEDGRVTYAAIVDSVEVALLGSYPVQVVVTARGSLRSGCEDIAGVSQRFEDDTFFVTVLGSFPLGIACTPVAPPFTERVTLTTADLVSGTYKVNVNGVVESFTLP
jgi:hypothetical protein